MTKQSKTSTSTSAAKVSVSSTVEAAAKAAVEQVKKSASRPKAAAAAAVAAVAVVEPVPAVSQPSTVQESVVESAAEASSVGDGSRKRRQVTREDLERSFDSLLALLDGEVESLRSVRFLRTVAKQVRQLKTDSMRVSSKRVRRQTAPRSTNSGFMKPVKISRDMQKFTGLGDDQLVSRVDVTKSICQYVKTQNLQNQADRRQFTPDDKLGKLLGTREPLTYYNLQKHIQHHFIKPVPVPVTVAV